MGRANVLISAVPPARRGWLPLSLLAAGVLLTASVECRAQATAPPSAEPGAVERRIRPPAPPPTAPQAPTAPTVPAAPSAAPAVRFVLAAVEIDGATVYTPADLAATYEQYLAKEVTPLDIEAITKAITARYRKDGYFLARALAPPQPLELGVLRIEVVEGYIGRVVVKGNVGGSQELIDEYVQKITAERPTTLANLERYILLINDLPGAKASASLNLVDADSGLHELVLTFDHKLIDAFATVDNRGTHTVGPYESLMGVNLNSALGLYDRTRVMLYTIPNKPPEYAYVELQHDEPIGSEGTRVIFTASKGGGRAGGNIRSLDIQSESLRSGVELSHPLIRSRKESLYISGKIELINQTQDQQAVLSFYDRLRVVRAGARYTLDDDLGGANYIAAEASHGFGILGASLASSDTLSRTGGRSEFSKLWLEMSRRQSLSDTWAVQLSMAGQKSGQRLLSAEEFYLGGTRYGRGYDPGELSGSDAAAMSAELQYGDFVRAPWLESYQIYGFYDAGVVWKTSFNSYTGRESLASAGLGSRLAFTPDTLGGFEIARPLTRPLASDDENTHGLKVFFYLSTRF